MSTLAPVTPASTCASSEPIAAKKTGSSSHDPSQESSTVGCASDPSEWIDLHGTYLYRYALRRLRDAALAEDAIQETMLAALKARDAYRRECSERTWLTSILRNKITDHFRQHRRLEQPFAPDDEIFAPEEYFDSRGRWKSDRRPSEWAGNPEEVLGQGEFWEVLDRGLSELPRRLAIAFTMREMDNLSCKEIAGLLSASESNVWVMLFRARTHLRRYLEVNWFCRKPRR